jgi:hypothetical protein
LDWCKNRLFYKKKLASLKDCLTKTEFGEQSLKLEPIPSPSSKERTILIPFCLQSLTKVFKHFVKKKGAEMIPNGRTVKQKMFLTP